MMRIRHVAVSITVAWLGLCAPVLNVVNVAHADAPGDKAAAEALFDQGLALMRKGDYAAACVKLEQSQSVDHGIGTMLYLGECYEKSGRSASAWALFRQAASEAAAGGESDRAATARSRAQRLEPSLSKLTITPSESVPGMRISRNESPVSSAIWGVPVPVDPGDYLVSVEAPGFAVWNGNVRVGPNGDAQTLTIPKLAPAPIMAPAAAPIGGEGAPATPAAVGSSGVETAAPPPTAAAAAASMSTSSEPVRGNTQRTIGLVVGAAGIVALGIGTVFGLKAISKNSDAKKHCSGSSCVDDEGLKLTDDAQSAATLSNVFVFGGAAVAITGVVLFLTAPHGDSTEQAQAKQRPTFAFGSDGRGFNVSVGGVL